MTQFDRTGPVGEPDWMRFRGLAGDLLAAVREDQFVRWVAGNPESVEGYLWHLPALTDEDALVLIVAEAGLRRRRGDAPAVAEYQARFPRLASALPAVFDLQAELGSTPGNGPMEDSVDPDRTTVAGRPDSGMGARGDGAAAPEFEILELLGRGGMGEVFKARQAGLNRVVALKMVLGGQRAAPNELIRFLAEAEAVAAVKHPHVVQVYGYGEQGGRPYLALEYLEGGSLAARLKAEGRLAPEPAAALIRKLALGVQAAHDQGIVHRDLKPGNVLFDADGEPRVTDFGLAKRGGGGDLTATQAVMGTPAYMAPEQAKGDTKFATGAADVYAIGVILYECLTGTRPFDAPDKLALLRKVVEEEPERPAKRAPGLPRDVELICLKCLVKDPAGRYATAADLADDLGRFLAGLPIRARPPAAVERVRKFVTRYPVPSSLAAGLAVVIVAALAVTTALYYRASRARDAADSNAALAATQAVRADQKAALAEQAVEDMLFALGNKLADTTDVPKVRREMYLRALELYRQFAAEPGGDSPRLRAKLADTLTQLARVRDQLNDLEGAGADFEEAIRLYQGLADQSGEGAGDPRRLLATLEYYALHLRKRGRLTVAIPLFEDVASRLAAAAADRPGDELLEADWARVSGNLGVLLAEVGQSRQALGVFRDATRRSEALVGVHPDWEQFRVEDARLRVKFGDVLLRDLRYEEAEPHYKAALEVLRTVQAANPDRISSAMQLTKCIENYAICLRELRRDRELGTLFETAAGIWDRLTEQFPEVPEYKLNRAISLTNSASLSRADRGKMEAALRGSVADLEWLADRYPGVQEYHERLAGATSNLAVLLVGYNRPAEALPLFARARRATLAQHPDGPTTSDKKDGFFRLLKGQGFAFWMTNRFESAAASFAEAAKYAPAPDGWEEATSLKLAMTVRSGRAAEAVAEVERLLKEGRFRDRQAVHAATVFGEASESAAGGSGPKEVYAKRAIELVRVAVDAGYADPANLESSAGFRGLLQRREFQDLVNKAAANRNANRPRKK